MKKQLISGIISALLMLAFPSFSQNTSAPCPADQSYRMQLNDPYKKDRIQQELQRISEQIQKMNIQKTTADSLRIIPCVIHVLHDNGNGAVSKEQLEDGIKQLNEDLRRWNQDTAATRALFKPYATDLNVEFRLANIDPNGQCTDGIIYTNTVFTYDVLDTCKAASRWPSDKYFNFWVVMSIDPSPWNLGGIIAGYEQFPWKYGINNTYGAVVRNDYWGRKGTASSSKSRTITHEVGHCLGLWHMWQDQSVGGVGDGCAFIVGHDCTDNDDKVCDTPPMKEPVYNCTATSNTCANDTIGPDPYGVDVVDQIENFMSYNSCQNMFSKGQRQRVEAVFQTYNELKKLISSTNQQATGTNNGYVKVLCPPVADILPGHGTLLCKGASVKFTDASKGGQSSNWTWNFPGGNPSSSTQQNPIVKYDSVGVFDVLFISSNTAGSDTIVYKKHIVVSDPQATYNAATYLEGWEDSLLYTKDWKKFNSNGKGSWKRAKGAAYQGNYAMMVNNTETWSNEVVELYSPSYDVSTVANAEAAFKVAFAKRDSTSKDELKISVSTDCGASWSVRYSKQGTGLATAPFQSAPFIPNTNQWRDEKINLGLLFGTSKNLQFKFEFFCRKGNNIYIDNFNIRDKTVGIEQLDLSSNIKIYPNPSDGNNISLDIDLPESATNVHIEASDILGRITGVLLNGTTLTSGSHHFILPASFTSTKGVYVIRMYSDSYQWTKKLVVE